jgi:hypothetical protein
MDRCELKRVVDHRIGGGGEGEDVGALRLPYLAALGLPFRLCLRRLMRQKFLSGSDALFGRGGVGSLACSS